MDNQKFAQESNLALVRRARKTYRRLHEQYPYARAELDFTSAWELLVATILSAQSTDVGVNKVTPKLFAAYPDIAAMAAATPEDIEPIIRPTGFFRVKARSVLGAAQSIMENFEGEVPANLADLVTLPGVGRKTAFVVLGNAFGQPGLTVDTHFGRLVNRLGWTVQTDPIKIEKAIGKLFPRRDWSQLSHALIFHGRRICHARKPACGVCPVSAWCPAYGTGPTDDAAARKLLAYELAPGADGIAPVPLLVDGAAPSADFNLGRRGMDPNADIAVGRKISTGGRL